MIDDYVLNVTRWEGMEKYVGEELWIAQKEYDHNGRFTTVEINPSEWVAPLENGKPIRTEQFNNYVLYVRRAGELFKEVYKEAVKNETRD